MKPYTAIHQDCAREFPQILRGNGKVPTMRKFTGDQITQQNRISQVSKGANKIARPKRFGFGLKYVTSYDVTFAHTHAHTDTDSHHLQCLILDA